jgi:hypothetical protein
MIRLAELNGLAELPAAFLQTGARFDVTPNTTEFPRSVDVEPLVNLLEEAQRRFTDDRVGSDRWLAGRIHHVLRLSRREAARRGLWIWLGVVAAPDYVRWRFPGTDGATDAERFLGREDKQAIARLWWGAELMRNGSDYSPVEIGFSMQDVPNTWMRLDLFHSRPLVQAVLRVLASLNGGGHATSDQVNRLATAVNAAACTVLVDSLAPDPEFDPDLLAVWLEEEVDETLLFAKDPVGPDDDPAPAAAVDAMEVFVRRIIASAPALRQVAAPA